MDSRIDCNGLSVARELYDLVNQEIIPGSGVEAEDFWSGFARLIADLGPANRVLLENRARIQARLNEWHRANPGPIDIPVYRQAFHGAHITPAMYLDITYHGIGKLVDHHALE